MQITGLENEDRFERSRWRGHNTVDAEDACIIPPDVQPTCWQVQAGRPQTKYSLNGRLRPRRRDELQLIAVDSTGDGHLMASREAVIERKEEKLEHLCRSRNIGHSEPAVPRGWPAPVALDPGAQRIVGKHQ